MNGFFRLLKQTSFHILCTRLQLIVLWSRWLMDHRVILNEKVGTLVEQQGGMKIKNYIDYWCKYLQGLPYWNARNKSLRRTFRIKLFDITKSGCTPEPSTYFHVLYVILAFFFSEESYHISPTISKLLPLWQYGLWSFQTGGTKLERFLPKNQHTQRKLLRIGLMGRCQKLGIILENKVI